MGGRCLLSLSWDFSAEYSNCFWAIIVATAKIARNAESLFRVIVLLEPIMPTANLFITTELGSETTSDLNCSTTSFARPNILGHKEDSYMVSSVDGTQFHSATRIHTRILVWGDIYAHFHMHYVPPTSCRETPSNVYLHR